MGNKNKTVSFRLNEDTFEALQAVAEQRDLSLSAVFRDYVDALVAHDGQVEVVPEGAGGEAESAAFPPAVEVPKSFVREHERLELEAEHLREQLEEHKRYIAHLREQLEGDDQGEVVDLDSLDEEAGRHREGERERDYETPTEYEL
jgi:predicted transcriptional regulator